MAHADLIIPKAWVGGAKYPDAGPEYGEGLVVEHYSSVFNAILNAGKFRVEMYS
jgi:hypothetical protein